ncbi:MAG: hypothetical protein IJW20_00225 [Clostridia bacterium]|nr:hypothetical protein [Clostridia bacterium]
MKVKKLSVGKTILLSLLVALIVFIVIRFNHYSILKRISDKAYEFNSSETYNVIIKECSDTQKTEREEFRKGNLLFSKTRFEVENEVLSNSSSLLMLEEKLCNKYSVDYTDNSLVILTESNTEKMDYGPTNFFAYAYAMSNIDISTDVKTEISNWIDDKILFPAVFSQEYNGSDCYVFNHKGWRRIWVDKESLLPLKVEWKNNDYEIYNTVTFEYNQIDDSVFEIPNTNDFDEVSYYDSGKQPELSWGKPAEEAISGTSLKPGEQLIENVEIEENEVLNFLGLTSNESGIISLNICSYETYNKFREKYSGLRELTEKDFERYYVTLAYKEGYKLNYLEQWESSQSYNLNCVVSAEKSNKDNLMVLITSKESNNRWASFVENDTKLKIDSYKAFEKIQDNLIDFQNFYGLKEQNSEGYRSDILSKLTNEQFANLEYIKTPVKGQEPICWKIDYRGYEYDTVVSMTIYVDATTGDIIGSTDFEKSK